MGWKKGSKVYCGRGEVGGWLRGGWGGRGGGASKKRRNCYKEMYACHIVQGSV